MKGHIIKSLGLAIIAPLVSTTLYAEVLAVLRMTDPALMGKKNVWGGSNTSKNPFGGCNSAVTEVVAP